ncbi:MAG: hypothetical protein HYT87_14875 [Nitrospirae bacterium]|nr:hypothetical protein [Nitrospirota bacterium]
MAFVSHLASNRLRLRSPDLTDPRPDAVLPGWQERHLHAMGLKEFLARARWALIKQLPKILSQEIARETGKRDKVLPAGR